jgi:hypothetical protein
MSVGLDEYVVRSTTRSVLADSSAANLCNYSADPNGVQRISND